MNILFDKVYTYQIKYLCFLYLLRIYSEKKFYLLNTYYFFDHTFCYFGHQLFLQKIKKNWKITGGKKNNGYCSYFQNKIYYHVNLYRIFWMFLNVSAYFLAFMSHYFECFWIFMHFYATEKTPNWFFFYKSVHIQPAFELWVSNMRPNIDFNALYAIICNA